MIFFLYSHLDQVFSFFCREREAIEPVDTEDLLEQSAITIPNYQQQQLNRKRSLAENDERNPYCLDKEETSHP